MKRNKLIIARKSSHLIMLLLLIGLLVSCHEKKSATSSAAEPPYDQINLPLVGKIKSRPTTEIQSSDLWIGCEVLDRDYADYHQYKPWLLKLGAKKARLQSGWAKTEKQKGVYDFEWLDKVVDDLLDKKIQPWMQISYGNPLYPGAGGISLGEGLPTSDEGIKAWVNYTKALVQHFNGRVKEWEVWNEADHGYNKSSGNEYGRLFYTTAIALREVQPDSKILALSIAGVGNHDFVKNFFDYLKERNGLDLVDVVTFHGYPHNPDEGFNDVAVFRKIVHSYSPRIELWQGETGCPSTLTTSGALRQHPWSEKLQAKWILRRALAHMGRGYPYLQFTISEYVYDSQFFKGLNSKGLLKINPDKTIAYAKPAFYAYQNLIALLDNSFSLDTSFSYQAGESYNMSAFAWKNKEGYNMVALWLDGSKPTETDWYIPIDYKFKGVSFHDPVLIDIRTGSIYELPKELFSNVDGSFEIKSLLVYDSPIILAERKTIQIVN